MEAMRDPSRWVGMAGILGALGFALYVMGGLITAVLQAPPPAAGEPAPRFSAEALDGTVVSGDAFEGQALLLDFWTTTCVGCIASLNRLRRFQNDYEGLQVLSFNQDPEDRRTDVQAVVRERNLNFPVAVGPGSQAAADAYRIRGFPTVVLVAPDRTVRAVHPGAVAESRLRRDIEAALP